MKYRYGQKPKPDYTLRTIRVLSLMLPFFLMSSVTTFSLGSQMATAPEDSELDEPSSTFILQGSKPHREQDASAESLHNEESAGSDDARHFAADSLSPDDSQQLQSVMCNPSSSMLSHFERSISPEIRKLAEYEQVCQGSFIHGAMLFMRMPADVQDAINLAQDSAIRIHEFSSYNLRPKIIMEPVSNSGPIDFEAFARGDFDSIMTSFYNELKKLGITDAELGDLIPFPEANIPVWGNTNPDTVARCISKLATLQKAVFPHSNISILLDSKSYPSGTSWLGGSYTSLLPYVASIPQGLIDSFGLQGYPWPDPQPEHRAHIFLNADLALEAAAQLGVRHIWFNTGTYKRGTAWDGKIYSLSPLERIALFKGMTDEVLKVKTRGYSVEIMLFAEDKFNTHEGNDWSFWQSEETSNDAHTAVFKAIQSDLASKSIPLSIFDSY